MKRATLSILITFLSLTLFAQKGNPPQNWFNLDAKKDHAFGISSDKTYESLLTNQPPKQRIIVAVIDGGTDILHEDLKGLIWVNTKETPDNGIDDDRNGYVDDIHGWNFIGGKDGDVEDDNLEMTRMYQFWQLKYSQTDTNTLDMNEKKRYYKFLQAKLRYEDELALANKMIAFFETLQKDFQSIVKKINKEPKSITLKDVKSFTPTSPSEKIVFNAMERYAKSNSDLSELEKNLSETLDYYTKRKKVHLNIDIESRKLVDENLNDENQKYYGNNHVTGLRAEHGTHVAGIIAALRNNTTGMKGVFDQVEIMVLRVVPDGDERDKDVANAIRYAVANGAKVINMSFGKSFSPQKYLVDDAVRYAMENDVLLVHAAGNDAANTDEEENYPKPILSDGSIATNWIEVGASSWKKKPHRIADFSNYGQQSVDVFAPGVDIYSCLPGSTYGNYSGTSMAAPVVAGLACALRAYYPELKASQIREIIMESGVKIKGKNYIPGQSKRKLKAVQMSKTGKMINMYEALLLARMKTKK
jgi:subtilisin family serine protease